MGLVEKQSVFAFQVAQLINHAYEMGFSVTLGETYRPSEMAQIYASRGNGICKSNHEIRLAIDLNLFKDGVFLCGLEDYRPLGIWWEAQSAPNAIHCWGGRFVIPDADHFSFEHLTVR